MKIRTFTETRLTWRDRFLEIGRMAEGVEAATRAFAGGGLRSRAKMAGFASVRRARPSLPGTL